MRKCDNLYTDLTALFLRPIELAWHLVLAKEYGLINKVMWGTDYPLFNPKNYVRWIQNDLNELAKGCGWPTFTELEINQILGDNAVEFLSL
jgi:predicted TIM-barrel fold metal-dependent hydrolase